MKTVTVYTSFSSADAQLKWAQLDAAGFHPEVQNELASLTLDGYAQAAGGIRVEVPEDEALAARELITTDLPPE